MELRFDPEIPTLAKGYVAKISDRDRELGRKLTHEIFPDYHARGFLTREHFLTVCAWKTPRTQALLCANEYIKEISKTRTRHHVAQMDPPITMLNGHLLRLSGIPRNNIVSAAGTAGSECHIVGLGKRRFRLDAKLNAAFCLALGSLSGVGA
ncbi:MAG: hypothetical protein R3C05_13700 [Pirellulaceae bacterium]